MKKKVKAGVMEFRANAENFLALAQRLSRLPASRGRDTLLIEARKTIALVKQLAAKADDIRTFARDVFGEQADDHPLAHFVTDAMTRTVNMTMGAQSYRMRQFIAGKIVRVIPRSPAGTMVMLTLSGIIQ